MESIYAKCDSCGCRILPRTYDRNNGVCKPCGWKAEARKREGELKARQRQIVAIREEEWLRMSPNGGLADEANALRMCLPLLGVGPQQVVREMTDGGPLDPNRTEELEQIAYHLQSHLISLERETICDFVSKNRTSNPASPLVTSSGEFILISNAQLTRLFRDEVGWDRFYELYPHSAGILEFSRIGLNADVTQALVCAGTQIGRLMGRGTYWVLEKSGDGWHVADSKMAWIS